MTRAGRFWLAAWQGWSLALCQTVSGGMGGVFFLNGHLNHNLFAPLAGEADQLAKGKGKGKGKGMPHRHGILTASTSAKQGMILSLISMFCDTSRHESDALCRTSSEAGRIAAGVTTITITTTTITITVTTGTIIASTVAQRLD